MNSNTQQRDLLGKTYFLETFFLKGGRKGAKGHLKAKVNGQAFRAEALWFTMRSKAKNGKTDK